MKITKIHVNNYRILQNFDFDFEDKLSLVIGKNNCGKTSLLTIFEKFIGNQSGVNNFSYNDFSNSFKDKLEDFIINDNKDWEKEEIKGIELFLYIQYANEDNFSNIQALILDLDTNNNMVVLKFEYILSSSKLLKLKSDFNEYADIHNNNDRHQLFESFLKTRYKRYFEIFKKAVLYDDKTKEASKTEYSILDSKEIDLSSIICFHSISAHRDTVNKEGDNTLSHLSSQYYEKIKTNQENTNIVKFEDILQEMDTNLTDQYNILFDKIINEIKNYGGVYKNESNVHIISTLSQQQLLKSNTTVVYQNSNHELPESYNGLGYLNLISMIMEIEIYIMDFLKIKDSNKKPAEINILFIEEPEAHTHPQLQYVFIKNIKKFLNDKITDESGKKLINLQTIVTTHSSHIVSECNFDDIKFFKKIDNKNIISKNLKELEILYKDEKGNNHFKFLKQYLTLNSAEIFFADKVILYEGETERILLPAMLKKIDDDCSSADEMPMLSQNISFLASGAYSQIFDTFLSFIDIKTLIITDIDAVKLRKGSNKNGKTKNSLIACPVNRGTETSNSALKHYYKKELSSYLSKNEKELPFFTTLPINKKILHKVHNEWESYIKGNMMVTFQTEEDKYYPRSFEDAFIQLNREFLVKNSENMKSLKNKNFLTKKSEDGKYTYNAYKIAENCIKSKSSFALDILLNSVEDDNSKCFEWKIPSYIKEGLKWLKKD